MNTYNEHIAIYLMIINIFISPTITIIIFRDNISELFNDPDYLSKQMNKQMDIEWSKILCVIFVSLYSDIVKTYSQYTYDTWYLFYVKNLKEINNKTNKKTHIYNFIDQTNKLISIFTSNLPHISANIFLVLIPKIIKELVSLCMSIYMTNFYLKNKIRNKNNYYEDVNLINVTEEIN